MRLTRPLVPLGLLGLLMTVTIVPVMAAGEPAATGTTAIHERAEASLRLHAFTLEHQRAADAMAVVIPLLSLRGGVEVQPGSNSLLVRDTLGNLARITAAVRAFDHPARPVLLTLQVVQAEGPANQVSPPSPIRAVGLSTELVERLRKVLPFSSYSLVAGAEFASREGQPVTYDLAGRYRITFQLGNMSEGQRLRVGDFRVERLDRGEGDPPLIHTNLNLTLGRTTVLGLARESSAPRALMVVLLAKPPDTAAAVAP